MTVFYLKLLISLVLVCEVWTLATPMYKYLKDLCPGELVPMTGTTHVRTCDDTCPAGGKCVQGICCTPAPKCKDLVYKNPTEFACLPNVKQNCPSSSKCVPSSRQGMSICCSLDSPKGRPMVAEQGVCPVSHPIISYDHNQLTLCKNCKKGVCVPFHDSDVKVCCMSSDELCGSGSTVQMDGHLPRNCNQHTCGEGFECSLTSSGSRVCCSYASCSNGKRARSVCAGGCRNDEKCEEIDGQRWCCPRDDRQMRCPDSKISNGQRCTPLRPDCPLGHSCLESQDRSGFLCCETLPGVNLLNITFPPMVRKETTPQPVTLATFFPTVELPFGKMVTSTEAPSKKPKKKFTVKPTTTTTSDYEVVPTCLEGSVPLEAQDGTYMSCPQFGEPCPKAGYMCQHTEQDGLYCCPLEEEVYTTSTTRAPRTTTTRRRPLARVFTTFPAITEAVAPACPYSYIPARSERNREIKQCFGLFDITCPFGYSCLPSSTTPTSLCCAKTG